jgi:hypothetical protein
VLVADPAAVVVDGDPAGVAAADQAEQVLEAAGGDDLELVVGVQADGDRGGRLRPGGDAVGGRTQWGHLAAEHAVVPGVDGGLVLGVPRDAGEAGGEGRLDLGVACPVEAGGVEEGEVDVAGGPEGLQQPGGRADSDSSRPGRSVTPTASGSTGSGR